MVALPIRKNTARIYDGEEGQKTHGPQTHGQWVAVPCVEQTSLRGLVKTKEPKVEWHLTARTDEQLTEYLAKAKYVAGETSKNRSTSDPANGVPITTTCPCVRGTRKNQKRLW